MNQSGFSFKRASIIGGSFIAFAIGSGFATGQEILQFYVPYGLMAVFSLIVFIGLNLYMNYNFALAGRKGQFEKGSQVFRYFCGPYIGTFYDWFTVLFVFMSFVVMVAGAGATLHQHFGIPVVAGAVLIAVLAAGTVVFGLNRMVDVIGRIGPLIILFSILAAILGLINGQTGVLRGSELAVSGEVELMKAGSTWYSAIIAYIGFGMLWFAAFFAAIGKNEEYFVNARWGVILGTITLAVTVLMVTLTLLANLELVASSQIPLLLVLSNVNHAAATVFSIAIFLGIYTTACPLLWTVSNRLAKEDTANYKVVTIVLAIAGLIIGLALPFNRLVNIIYVINGYVGFVLMGFIVIRNLRDLLAKKGNSEKKQVEPA